MCTFGKLSSVYLRKISKSSQSSLPSEKNVSPAFIVLCQLSSVSWAIWQIYIFHNLVQYLHGPSTPVTDVLTIRTNHIAGASGGSIVHFSGLRMWFFLISPASPFGIMEEAELSRRTSFEHQISDLGSCENCMLIYHEFCICYMGYNDKIVEFVSVKD